MGAALPLIIEIGGNLAGILCDALGCDTRSAVHNPGFKLNELNKTRFASNICLDIAFPFRNFEHVPANILKLCDKKSTICCAYEVTNKRSEHPPFLISSVNVASKHAYLISKKALSFEAVCKEKAKNCKPYCCKKGIELYAKFLTKL